MPGQIATMPEKTRGSRRRFREDADIREDADDDSELPAR